MKQKIFLILVIFLVPYTFVNSTFASSENIFIVGENTDVDFSLEKDHTNNTGKSFFNETTNTISGKLYLKKIGSFAVFKNVQLDCPQNLQQKICSLSGSISNSVIGNISLSNIRYNQNTKQFSGNLTSKAGSFSMTGIGLEASNIEFDGLDTAISANHKQKLTIKNPVNTKFYELSLSYNGRILQKYSSKDGTFENVDLSLAGDYKLTISVNNKNRISQGQKIIPLKVLPTLPSRKIIPNTIAQNFCEKNPNNTIICPDGKERKGTYFIESGSHEVGIPGLNFFFKIRDQYGNRVGGQPIIIIYQSDVRTNQITNMPGDNAIILPHFQKHKDSYARVFSTNVYIDNVFFSLGSYAPTNSTNTIKLKSVRYGTLDITSLFLPTSVNFLEPFSVKMKPEGQIYPGKENIFLLDIQKNTKKDIIPTISGHFTLHSGKSYFTILPKPLSNWCHGSSYNEITAPPCTVPFTTLQTYAMFQFIGDASQKIKILFESKDEKSILGEAYTLVKYMVDNQEIRYKSNTTIFRTYDKARVFGNGDDADTRTLMKDSRQLSRLFSEIRKNIAYLKRNVENFNNLSFEVKDSDFVINKNTLQKQSYIVVGGDIILEKNIINSQNKNPITLIALAKDGIGGNIKIAENVTDIHATLIAEKNILNINTKDTKKNQLYIFGSVFAQNACLDNNNALCIANLRNEYDGEKNTTSQTAPKSLKYTPVIIKYNPAIISNPPPGLRKFTE